MAADVLVKQGAREAAAVVYAPSQWGTTLQCNVVSHWLGAYTKWSLLLKLILIPHHKALQHDDVMTRKQFLHYWLFVRGIHQSQGDSPHKVQVIQTFYVFFADSLTTVKLLVTWDAARHPCHVTLLCYEQYWRVSSEYWKCIHSALLANCAGNSPAPGEFPHKGQWRGAKMFSLICTQINSWVNNHEAGDLRSHRTHYDVIVMHQEPKNFDKHVSSFFQHFTRRWSSSIKCLDVSRHSSDSVWVLYINRNEDLKCEFANIC